jgi:hypothetical protein
MGKPPPHPIRIAQQFRSYAELCLAFAESEHGRRHASDLLKQAARWEADARMVELDERIIESSLMLLAKVGGGPF